jgi:UDP-N-acetylglucosamine--N-acetylmuramyl-(pentapeptide) pyrophosphoryl-undecaprenol N-acetylglucosamine transferase
VPEAGIPFEMLPTSSLRDPDSRVALLRAMLGVPVAYFAALWHVARFRPRVCCTSGGAVAIPVVLAARTLRVPVYLWAGDALPGRASRLLGRFCTKIGTTFDQARYAFPPRRASVSGTPIRASLLRWSRDDARTKMGVPANAALIVVTGGSQGSERVNDAIFGALPRLLQKAYVLHVTGESHFDKATARERALPEELRARYLPRAYLRDEMGAVLAAADLVIGRAGSSSIAEPLAFGVPLVLIPFAAAMEGHQKANARAAAEAGAALVIQEGELDADRLTAKVTGLLNDSAQLGRMANAAKNAGRRDAARDIARDLLAMGGCA